MFTEVLLRFHNFTQSQDGQICWGRRNFLGRRKFLLHVSVLLPSILPAMFSSIHHLPFTLPSNIHPLSIHPLICPSSIFHLPCRLHQSSVHPSTLCLSVIHLFLYPSIRPSVPPSFIIPLPTSTSILSRVSRDEPNRLSCSAVSGTSDDERCGWTCCYEFIECSFTKGFFFLPKQSPIKKTITVAFC